MSAVRRKETTSRSSWWTAMSVRVNLLEALSTLPVFRQKNAPKCVHVGFACGDFVALHILM